MRILIVHPNFAGRYSWAVQSVLEEIAKQSDAVLYGWRWDHHGNLFIPEVVKELGPFDVLITGDFKYNNQFEGIGQLSDVFKVIFLVDYYPRNFAPVQRHIKKNEYDVAILRSTQTLRFFKSHQKAGAISDRIKPFYFPWSVDTNFFDGREAEKNIDIMAVFAAVSWAYPRRAPLQRYIQGMSGVSSLIGGTGKGRLSPEDYRDAIARSRVFACANGEWNEMTLKYFECLASGTFMLTDKPNDCHRVGLKDGEHLVYFNGMRDFEIKARYYLKNVEEREAIAAGGKKFVRKRHSCEMQAKELLGLFDRERSF